MEAAPNQDQTDAIFDLIVVGGASVDTFLNLVENDPKWRLNLKTKELCFRYGEKITVESSQLHMGGNAQNVAVGISRLGYKTALMAEVGDDFFAEEVGRNLLKENVDTSLVLHSKGKATSSSVIMNLKGDRTLFSQHASHDHEFSFPADVATRMIYLTSLGGTWRGAYQTVLDFAKSNNVPIAFNPGTRQISEKGDVFWNAIKQTYILFLNLEEAKSVLRGAYPKKSIDKLSIQQIMEELAGLGPKIVVITDGKNGSYARAADGRCFEQGLVPATVVERTGAGDSFATGLIGAALSGKSLQKAMYWGAKNAASVVGRVGAEAGLLNRQQIESEVDPLLVGLGSDEPLVTVPFDHRTSLAKYCFNTTLDKLTPDQVAHLKDDKMVVYEGVKEAIALGLPQTEMAIVVDEQFGQEVIELANRENMAVVLPVEKSGQKTMEFEYGDQFTSHIEKFKPSFTKALAYYNPGDSLTSRKEQQARLKQLSDYSHQHGYKLLLEVITKPTKKQLEKAKNSLGTYQQAIEPELRLKLIQELQEAGVEPDVWKFGYFNAAKDYQQAIKLIRRDGRENVGVIISDYDADSQQIAKAITGNANVSGVIGYAAGSAVFWDAILDYHKGVATRQQARNRIAQEIMNLYQVYKQTKSNAGPEVVASHTPAVEAQSHSSTQTADDAYSEITEGEPTPTPSQNGGDSDHNHWVEPEELQAQASDEAESKQTDEQEAALPKRSVFSKLFKR